MTDHHGSYPERAEVLHRSSYDAAGGERLTTGVLLALDEVPGCDVESREFVAFENVDPDALDALFEPSRNGHATAQVTFPVEDFLVTATDDGEIEIRER